jgi:hypothetical protein
VLAVEVVDERAEGVAAALDGLVAAGVGAQDGRDPDLDGHGVRFSSGIRVQGDAAEQRVVRLSGATPARRPGFRTTGQLTPQS